MTAGRPTKYKNKEELEAIIENYFNTCEANNEPITFSGLAYELGMSRRQLLEYEVKDEFNNSIKKARNYCERYAEGQLFQGKNVAGVIFNLKNNYDWTDKNITEVQGGSIEININRKPVK